MTVQSCYKRDVPRQVDHDERRAAIAAALWRVVRRSGMQAVSVRSVAAEAATSPSALRHYFGTQDELLGFALTAVVHRVEARLLPQWDALTGERGALTIVEQFLPVDEDRRIETEVYLAFIGRAYVDPALRTIRDSADARTHAALRHALELLAAAGALAPGRRIAAETDRLHALVDGLAMHGALLPERCPPAYQRRVLRAHLRDLAAR